jgi:hypothetical protein
MFESKYTSKKASFELLSQIEYEDERNSFEFRHSTMKAGFEVMMMMIMMIRDGTTGSHPLLLPKVRPNTVFFVLFFFFFFPEPFY